MIKKQNPHSKGPIALQYFSGFLNEDICRYIVFQIKLTYQFNSSIRNFFHFKNMA